MELRQLRYLVALAEEGQFTRAALRLRIAQPALSQQIRKLEDELGLVLFVRSPRGAVVTAAGAEVLAHARAVLAEVGALRDEAGRLTGLQAGRLAIGVTATAGPADVVGLLGGFHRRHPQVELAVAEGLSVELMPQVADATLDVGLITTDAGAGSLGLQIRRLAAERLVAVLHRGHRLAGRRRLRLADLADERFVAFRRGATIRTTVERLAAEAGFVPRVAFETGEVMRARALVAQGLGVAVLPVSDAAAPGPPVAAVGLIGRDLVLEIFLAWRRERRHGPALRAFVDHVTGAKP